VCGGLGGVMEAAAKGAKSAGGTVVGILPGENADDANASVDIAIPTGMGIARNVLVVRAADVVIALPGSYGTLSETAVALSLRKTVIYLPGAWNLKRIGQVESALFKEAFEPAQAVGLALSTCL
ncbi:MAG: TIGR00725 family protein, partial [Chitinivibrionales bacterium]|nr:TIGR00725 family protein [Chitinivibrionales bacterium]MBD3357005.1 TIGR00725 family protein [Chitinivibrionales bacterium]